MSDNKVAKAYARASMELGKKADIDVASELTNFQKIVNSSNELENVLFLDIFTFEERKAILGDIFEKSTFSELIKNFIYFVLEAKRIHLLPVIYKEVMVIDDLNKGFLGAVIEGKEEAISSDLVNRLTKYVEKKIGVTPKFTYKQNKSLSAGNKVTAGDLQLDTTIDHQLDLLKDSILGEEIL